LNVSSLPSGTENQTLRHNGTAWESTKQVNIIDDSPNGSTNITIGDIRATSYPKAVINKSSYSAYLGAYYSYTKVVEFSANSSGGSILVTGDVAKIQLTNPSGAGAYISNTSAKFTYLSGTGTRNLVALPDGTIAVDTNATTKSKIINHTVTAGGSIFSFDNTALGISGDLTTKILSFEILRKSGANTYFSAGEFMLNEKTLSSTAVTFQSNGTIPTNDVLRIAITYTE
jgi:hypothetical protein